MTTTAAPEAVTPTVRATLRRARFWIIAALVVAVIGIGTAVANSTASLGGEFDPANPGPEGARALRSVLEQQGVRVRVTTTVEETAAASGTLLVDDAEASLTAAAWRPLARANPVPGTTAAGP